MKGFAGKTDYYNNRELSWLAFNERVLEEAEDPQNPLLERLKFLAIFSSNLDEFFMVRVAGLQDQVRAGFNKPEDKAGMTPKEQLARIAIRTQRLVKRQTALFTRLMDVLRKEEQIGVIPLAELNKKQQRFVKEYFESQIFPVLTPVAVDAYRPFPTLFNKTMNLIVTIEEQGSEEPIEKTAIVQVPPILERFIEVPGGKHEYKTVLLEDVIVQEISRLFKGYSVRSILSFRITRNADLTIHEEGAQDLLVEIEKELKKRKWGAACRLEVQDGNVDEKLLSYLCREMEVQQSDIYFIDGPLDLTALFSFNKNVPDHNHLRYEAFIPQPPMDLRSDEDLFEKALSQDLFFHHPYESFVPIVDFVKEAADDPKVLAIKQTLYRVSGNSPVIQALKQAAENGKQVTVLVELKARFDEENNVHWAKELEQAGCLVIYGMHNLKTHSKITLIIRRAEGEIQRFVHLGTGNYNDQTAKLYTDMGIITSKQEIGIDATNFFNFLSGYTEKPVFNHLIISPFDIRNEMIRLIREEMDAQKKHGKGFMKLKMNSLTDKELIVALYKASMAGVKIDLIVRGICCLRPGIPGVSDNIRVISIVGRFLEHSRVYWFHHGGEEKVYLSSADMMTRNMTKRIEILFPVLEDRIKKRVMEFMDIQLADTAKARLQDANGEYHYAEPGENGKFNSQDYLLEQAYNARETE